MMVFVIILTAFTYVSADQKCDGVLVDGVMLVKEVLKRDLNSPYQFTIDYNSNILFFSYSMHDKKTSFQSAYLNLNTGEFKVISTVEDGFASAVDLRNDRVFIGAKDGIYNFNLKTEETNHLITSEQNIWQMFFKDGLYYTTFPNEEAYLFEDGTSKRLHELSETRAMLIAIGQNNNIYFSNSSGLFEYDKNKKEIMLLGEYVINGINADANGKIYFSSPDGIFFINDKQNIVQCVVKHDNIYAAAIGKDGSIVYGTEDSIIRLRKNYTCKAYIYNYLMNCN